MIGEAPDTRKHFYDLTEPEDREDAKARIESFQRLDEDSDRTWTKDGWRYIVVNQLCIKYTYTETGDILYVEWKTRHKSNIEHF